MATLESLESALNTHILHANDKHNFMVTDIRNLSKEMNTKVSFSTFTWFVGIMILVLSGIFGYLVIQLEGVRSLQLDTKKDVSQVQEDVSSVKGKLDPYNIQFKN